MKRKSHTKNSNGNKSHMVYNWHLDLDETSKKLFLSFWLSTPQTMPANHTMYSTIHDHLYYGYRVRIHEYAFDTKAQIYQFMSKSGHINVAAMCNKFTSKKTPEQIQSSACIFQLIKDSSCTKRGMTKLAETAVGLD